MITEAECANTKNDLETHLNISDKTTRYDTNRFLVVSNPWFVYARIMCGQSYPRIIYI